MSRNVRRKANALNNPLLRNLGIGCVILTIPVMVYIALFMQNMSLADEIKRLDDELSKLEERNKSLQATVDYRRAPRRLQDKIEFFNLGLVSISDPSIQILEVPAGARQRPGVSYANREGRP